MPVIINMPKLGSTMTKGIISAWLKKEGEWVEKGEPLVGIETDKLVLEYESPESGYLLKILFDKGAERDILTPVCILGQPGEDIGRMVAECEGKNEASIKEDSAGLPGETKKAAGEAARWEESEKILITPLAKKIAEENGLDYTGLKGTGPEGRIDRKDILAAIGKEKTS